MLTNWGEGTSDSGTGSGSGSGGPSQTGDATWLHTFYDTQFWTNEGGDFDAVASGSTVVGTTLTSYTWASTAGLLADVQAWLDDPANNFGWALVADESVINTVRRFASRENSDESLRPTLTITFMMPVPEPAGWILGLSGLAVFVGVVRRKGLNRR